MFNPEDQHYIGDGVYASVKNGMIKLSTAASYTKQEIYLELKVYDALVRFKEQAQEYYANKPNPDTNYSPI